MSLTIISNSVCALPNFNPATTDFSDSILGERKVRYSIPGCKTCENYIMRYEYVEKILQLMNELFEEAEKNKEKNLRDLNKAKGTFEKIEEITGWSAHLVERVLQNTFDS